MPKINPEDDDISNSVLLRLPSFLGIRDKDFCSLLGYSVVWLSRLRKDIDNGRKDPDEPAVTQFNSSVIDAIEKNIDLNNQQNVTWQLLDLYVSLFIKKYGCPQNIKELIESSRSFKVIKRIYDEKSDNYQNILNLADALINGISEVFNAECLDSVRQQFKDIISFNDLSDRILSEGFTPAQFVEDYNNEKFSEINSYVKKKNISLDKYKEYLQSDAYKQYIEVKKNKAEKIASVLKEQGMDLKNFLVLTEISKK
ncbi:MAG: hypothetical protein ACI4M9_08470 [Succinivibrio sp.]